MRPDSFFLHGRSIRWLLLSIGLCFYSLSAAQGGFVSLTETKFTIDTVEYAGYKSYFEFPREKVMKGFWNYTKSFGHGENRRSHYRLTIPPRNDTTHTAIVLIGKPEDDGSTCVFSLGMDVRQLNQNPAGYRGQLKVMLLEFKTDLYLRHFQDRINALSNKGKKLSKQHQKALKKGQIYEAENAKRLEQLHGIEQEIEQLRNQQVRLLSLLKAAKKQE